MDLTYYEYRSLASERHIFVGVLKGLRVEQAMESLTRLEYDDVQWGTAN